MMECDEPGCHNGIETGHALYRTSPKGEDWEGKCEEHFTGQIEPIAQLIERRNMERNNRH
jgi:hypothetical protein